LRRVYAGGPLPSERDPPGTAGTVAASGVPLGAGPVDAPYAGRAIEVERRGNLSAVVDQPVAPLVLVSRAGKAPRGVVRQANGEQRGAGVREVKVGHAPGQFDRAEVPEPLALDLADAVIAEDRGDQGGA